jgi:hypothetical protein
MGVGGASLTCLSVDCKVAVVKSEHRFAFGDRGNPHPRLCKACSVLIHCSHSVMVCCFHWPLLAGKTWKTLQDLIYFVRRVPLTQGRVITHLRMQVNPGDAIEFELELLALGSHSIVMALLAQTHSFVQGNTMLMQPRCPSRTGFRRDNPIQLYRVRV